MFSHIALNTQQFIQLQWLFFPVDHMTRFVHFEISNAHTKCNNALSI